MDNVLTFSKSVFRGFGQIMLQANYWTGILFLIAICYDSVWMGVAALLSNIVGTLTAKILKFDKTNIEDGLYGFNATLVGVALVFYFQFNIWVALAIIIGSAVSTVLMEIALRKKFPAFTFPFILVTWILLFILSIPHLALPTVSEHFVDIAALEDFWIEGHAFGQVIFQGSVIAGLIFMIAVFINSPIGALYGFVASVISMAISHHFHEPVDLITAGVFSFNAVLCGIACSGLKPRDGIYVFIAVVLSTLIDIWMIEYGWTTLTFPFVFSMWVVLLIKKYTSNIKLRPKHK